MGAAPACDGARCRVEPAATPESLRHVQVEPTAVSVRSYRPELPWGGLGDMVTQFGRSVKGAGSNMMMGSVYKSGTCQSTIIAAAMVEQRCNSGEKCRNGESQRGPSSPPAIDGTATRTASG